MCRRLLDAKAQHQRFGSALTRPASTIYCRAERGFHETIGALWPYAGA